ncbi:MAG: hypothetical protein QM755_02605 [Luteolibacter sp.]
MKPHLPLLAGVLLLAACDKGAQAEKKVSSRQVVQAQDAEIRNKGDEVLLAAFTHLLLTDQVAMWECYVAQPGLTLVSVEDLPGQLEDAKRKSAKIEKEYLGGLNELKAMEQGEGSRFSAAIERLVDRGKDNVRKRYERKKVIGKAGTRDAAFRELYEEWQEIFRFEYKGETEVRR